MFLVVFICLLVSLSVFTIQKVMIGNFLYFFMWVGHDQRMKYLLT